MTKQLTVSLIWKNEQTVDVPDDYEPLDDDKNEWMDQVDSLGAYLADWVWDHE